MKFITTLVLSAITAFLLMGQASVEDAIRHEKNIQINDYTH